jgi:hypothetical protein
MLAEVQNAPPLSEAAHLCKQDERVYDHDNDEGWLCKVKLHEGFPTVSSPYPQQPGYPCERLGSRTCMYL